jgi:hypothetical protein
MTEDNFDQKMSKNISFELRYTETVHHNLHNSVAQLGLLPF